MELETTKSLFRVPFPELSVRALNNKTVSISSEMVSCSRKLRRRMIRHLQEYHNWPMGPNIKFTLSYTNHIEEISEIKFIDCTKDITDGSDRDVFGKLPMLSSYVWRMLNEWSVFHILQVKQQLQERERENAVNWNKPTFFNPPPPPPQRDWNSVSRFEEEMFGSMDPTNFLALVQGKNDLGLDDLHKVLENWFRLYTGREVTVDKDGNEVSVEPCMTYRKNFHVESNHHVSNVNFYRPAIRSVPFNAKGWTWWCREKYGSHGHSAEI